MRLTKKLATLASWWMVLSPGHALLERSQIDRIKKPGERMFTQVTELEVLHNPNGEELDAHERLLGDAMKGDGTLFARQDGVEAAWALVEPSAAPPTPQTSAAF